MSGGGEPGGAFLEWGAAGAGLEPEDSGDLHVVVELPHGGLVGVVDGLGHGFEAAEAARAAVRILERFAGEPVLSLVDRCHEALHGTRGAVMTLAAFDARDSRMTWVGVGNVEGILLRADRAARPAREALAARGGIVGYQIPSPREHVLQISPGDTLVIATDGIRSAFADRLGIQGTPQDMAEAILARHASGFDDALVVVARWVGAAP